MRGSVEAKTKNNNESKKKEGMDFLPHTRITRANMFEDIEIVHVYNLTLRHACHFPTIHVFQLTIR